MSFRVRDTSAVYQPVEQPHVIATDSKKDDKKKSAPISKKKTVSASFHVRYDPTNQADYF